MKILSVNAGSSTLKFRLYEMPEEKVLMKGTMERIGLEGSNYSIRIGEEKIQKDLPLENHTTAVNVLLKELVSAGLIQSLDEIEAVGHRIVHGGNLYSSSVIMTDRVIQEIENISELAPLHNPANLIGVKAFQKAIPSAIQVGCFDTAFHQTMKEVNYLYPVPYEWYIKYHVRKYGFHGLSHKFVSLKMAELLHKENPNLITCHIGNGASISAIKEGKCIDTSMGFTPNAGIMMGTRSGDIDYTMLSYVMKKTGYNLDKLDSMLNRESGLEAIAGMSDLRDLDRAYEANEEKVLLAFDMYTEKIVEYIAKYYVKLDGKVDAICFTAGGGENDTIIRGETLKKLTSLGIVLDEEKNNQTIVRKGVEGVITSPESKIPVYVVATDEELMIARDTYILTQE
ncbi:MAG TPA: acetate kinase [Candidatus Scybalousia intestinigallinarum]|nr:acetate kinase [Candidatus Scybalousia intestinigallinarum]